MDFNPEVDWHRLVRFLVGESSPEQEKNTRAWILEDEDRAKLMDDLKHIWDASETSIPSRDLEGAWEDLRPRLEAKDDPTTGPSGRLEERSSRSPGRGVRDGDAKASRSRARRPLRGGRSLITQVAILGGIFIALVSVALVYYEDPGVFGEKTEAQTFTTEAGERATVRLKDGSQVRLNVDSRLELSAGYGDTNRRVSLDGEAHFEVTDDRANPFLVQTEGGRTKVLGTTFAIRAYPEEPDRRVAVAEGKVTVHPRSSARRDTVQLTADNVGVFTGGHVQVVRRNADIQNAIAWTEGRLVFDDTSFDRVVRELERWYDVPVKSTVEAGQVDRLNATFEEESLSQALKAISVALDLQFRKEERTVVFYRRD